MGFPLRGLDVGLSVGGVWFSAADVRGPLGYGVRGFQGALGEFPVAPVQAGRASGHVTPRICGLRGLVVALFAAGGIGIASADSGTGSPSGPAGRLPGSGAVAIAPDDI